jgi:hypothetical protein
LSSRIVMWFLSTWATVPSLAESSQFIISHAYWTLCYLNQYFLCFFSEYTKAERFGEILKCKDISN